MSSSDRPQVEPVTRREAVGLLLAAGTPVAAMAAGGPDAESRDAMPARAPVRRMKPSLALVSRHLQWTTADEGIEVAREAGFPGILWTVRRGAHIETADVERELPRVVKRTKDAGMETPMIITAIGDGDAANAEVILATMQGLGIRLYRAGAQRYDFAKPLGPQFDEMRRKLAAIARMNEKYGVTAAFHTHAYADSIGGSAWDLWMLMRDLDPRYVGLNYDIAHVMAKGGNGWRESIRAVGPYLHSVSVKDFLWEKEGSVPDGQWPWRTRFVAPGQGMVNFLDFFRYLQSIDFQGPLENYFEYSVDLPGRNKPFDMLGTNYGQWKLEMSRQTFVGFLKRDLAFYNGVWQKARNAPPAPDFSVKARD